MQSQNELVQTLTEMEGKPYPAYKSIKGGYRYKGYEIWIDHVQGDPFAIPTKARAKIPISTAGFPVDTFHNECRSGSLCDFLARQFYHSIKKYNTLLQGSGKSGTIQIDRPGQEVLKTSSMVIIDGFIEARFLVGLPAFGRRIAGKIAAHMFLEVIPRIVNDSLYFQRLPADKLYRHVETIEDAEFIRERLSKMDLIAFIADNAVLPRASGVDPHPLRSEGPVPFQSCQSMRVSMTLPNHGKITGMGIRKGVTLIVGGGYHGKSTLLNALEYGIYNHIPDDGREFVVTNPDAVKIRAEDGRSIQNLNIDPFISNLPFDQDTTEFSTANASGSTSQAANILEALEVGALTLLLDEDTLATNFMIRDIRMKALIAKEREPITPFVEHVRSLYEKKEVSTVIVMGGSGDYFSLADTVIGMIEYKPHDLTSQAHQIARENPSPEYLDAVPPSEIPRIPIPDVLNPSKGKRPVDIKIEDLLYMRFGTHKVQVGAIEQLVHPSQLRTIGYAIHYARRYTDGQRSIKEICRLVLADIQEKGLDCLSDREARGDFAEFRSYELAATLNRFRALRVKQRC
ncbi:MAG: ABC-ATPase domain-containing protein [Candidatus Scalindua sp.]|jgi:predicted ABC-class ATPase|nr:ABC-ATPase domain-containing protein [Candidatus Scalindua sp.]MBT6562510.1 ABC-ATPase domain-containing protein [Candidatus Scalindua sp.]MBT7213427.1 ABC-ATPase domain-containing protein [Candidatus Scalindua sp.]MBT7590956.1 ABC-ATPase domain-containing protein [Candidatus Scalindua sp.]